MWMRPLLAVITLGLAACSMCGCGSPPVVGEWLSDAKLSNGERNRLSVSDTFDGDARIWATSKSDPTLFIKFKFNFSWEDGGQDFDFNMKCTEGPCSNDDFTMRCQVISEDSNKADKMDCRANNRWKQYPFNWERSG